MVLVANNDVVIYTNASTDPYRQLQVYPINSELQSTLTSVIGEANYDVGHLFALLAVVEMQDVLVAFVNGSKEAYTS
jgi:hypothetical protein